MSNILVTGGAGFIASSMAARLAEDPANTVVIVDNFVTGKPENIPNSPHGNIHFVKCDVNNYRDISEVFFSWRFDMVFHYAALVGVQRTLNNPVKVLDDIDGIRNILNLCKNGRVKRVLYSSSSEVYGEPFEIPQNEHTTPLNSRLPYAIVKNAGEAWLKAYEKEYGLSYSIFRFFNTYGPHQSDDFVISKFIKAALANEDITIYGDGMQTRTFCYIDDNVEACYRIAHSDDFRNEVVNIGSDHEITILELAQRIIRLSRSQSQIVHLPALKEGDMSRRKPDISLMRSILKDDLTELDQGLLRVIDAFNPVANVRN
ncbi:NAD-dependent epimerase/dehydratase family protein [Sanyastnella coralliicola]|uniref:NAD-dependent epimerase/dehydratase family protein n=1 Tax=Sanyastnella coralliicola TaxID=3069118 RepID=UPI0027BAA3B5|nr:NAD-dependent epimerase/dehydratase family protein [Longitalea sp. SCSIO 12813]